MYLRSLVLLLVTGSAVLAHAPKAGETLVILPFENQSRAPNLEWIGDSFPEIVGQKMLSKSLDVIGRQERLAAFDRLGIPTSLRPSRATSYRLAREMDADYVVFGRYHYDGNRLRVTAQLLKMGALRLTPVVTQAGPLPRLVELQTALAGDLLRLINPDLESRLDEGGEPRLEAFEQYVRGLTASTHPEQIGHFKEALRLSPDYSAAMLQLGKAYYATRDYAVAANWLAKVPKADPLALEASFHLGMAAYYSGDFQRAENAFAYLSSKIGLGEFYNNLGVVTSRRGKQDSVEHFRKAVEVDPQDPDLRFNLAVSLHRSGDVAGAQAQLRQMLSLRNHDREARAFLDSLTNSASTGTTPVHPLERIKRSFDEALFRQLSFDSEPESPASRSESTPPADSPQ